MIVLTDAEFLNNEAAYINALFDNGLEVLHLRKPNASKEEMKQLLHEISDKYHYKIMIHSHYDLSTEFNLRGLHFTSSTKHLIDNYLETKGKKSQSIHEIDELKTINKHIDYVFLSPLFPSISKAGYTKPWNFMDLIVALKNQYSFEIIPLGGINTKNVVIAKEFGFKKIAVLGSIWEPVKAGGTIEEMLNIYELFKSDKY